MALAPKEIKITPDEYLEGEVRTDIKHEYNNGYVASGNTSSDGERDYVYDAAGRLARVLSDDGLAAEFVYNGKGQRVIKKAGPASTGSASKQNTVYHYDLDGRLIAETAGNGKLLAEYI